MKDFKPFLLGFIATTVGLMVMVVAVIWLLVWLSSELVRIV